jgi:hypothetical protein
LRRWPPADAVDLPPAERHADLVQIVPSGTTRAFIPVAWGCSASRAAGGRQSSPQALTLLSIGLTPDGFSFLFK